MGPPQFHPDGIWLDQRAAGLYEVLIRWRGELRMMLQQDDLERLLGVLQDWLGLSVPARAAWAHEPRCVLQQSVVNGLIWLSSEKPWDDGRIHLRLIDNWNSCELTLDDENVLTLVTLCQQVVEAAPELLSVVPMPKLPGLNLTPAQPTHVAQLQAWVGRLSYRATMTSLSESTLLHLTWGRDVRSVPGRQITDWAVTDDHGVLLGGLRCTHGQGLNWCDLGFWYHSPGARTVLDDLMMDFLRAQLLPFQRVAVASTTERHALNFVATLVGERLHESIYVTRPPRGAIVSLHVFTSE